MTTIGRRLPAGAGPGGSGALPRRADHQDPSAGGPPLPARGTGDHRGPAARLAGVRAADEQAAHRAGRTRPSAHPARRLLGDKAYSNKKIRAHLRRRRIAATIPEPADQIAHRVKRGIKGGRPPAFDVVAYKDRNTTERAFNKLKAFRAVAMRTDKRDYDLPELSGQRIYGLTHAAGCRSRYSSRTCFGVRY